MENSYGKNPTSRFKIIYLNTALSYIRETLHFWNVLQTLRKRETLSGSVLEKQSTLITRDRRRITE